MSESCRIHLLRIRRPHLRMNTFVGLAELTFAPRFAQNAAFPRNIFAVFGLRSLFFILREAMTRSELGACRRCECSSFLNLGEPNAQLKILEFLL